MLMRRSLASFLTSNYLISRGMCMLYSLGS